MKNCSLFEADSHSEAEVLHAFTNLMINGRRVVARVGGENEKMLSRPARPSWKKRKQGKHRK